MTFSTTAPSQSSVTSQNESSVNSIVPALVSLTERGYSDSVVPSSRMSSEKQQGILCHDLPAVTLPPLAPTGPLESTEITPSQLRRKAIQDLRLPSFQALGIAAPTLHPAALLTPPDESALPNDSVPSITYLSQPRSHSVPRTTMPQTPEWADIDAAPTPTVEGATPRQEAIPLPEAGGQESDIEPLSDSAVEVSGSQAILNAWVIECVNILVESAIQNTTRFVVSVLCHSQPCPLPSEERPTTAFSDLMTAVQWRIPSNAYIEITHAIPLKFNLGQVPNSPAITPNLQLNPSNDYFSILNTFSKAVVAASYQDALESSVPSSPHPVVAPSTVHVSLLERYIPPPSPHEYQDLFTTDTPSALVNRLTELSPDGGSLLFVYPTKTGAIKFQSDYLGPLLNPLLRTMSGVHGLRSDLGTNVATMASIDQMQNFDAMQRKLKQLLTKLGRGSSNIHRPPPKFEIIHSSVQKVPVDRTSWQTWYIHQEKSRIQEIVKRYFQRGLRLPMTDGVTPGAICREILQGLPEREYAPDCPPKDGIEVGLFVIQRTA